MKDPETGIGNMSLHRQQIMGPQKTGFVMLPRHARRIYDKYSQQGQHPCCDGHRRTSRNLVCRGITTSFGLDELEFAGGLLGELLTVSCETIDVDVPAEAEIVLEGELLPGDHLEPEGPFGEVNGIYPDGGEAHVFRLKAITRRKDAIYYALHCGFPPTDTQATTGLGIQIATIEHMKNVDGGLDCSTCAC